MKPRRPRLLALLLAACVLVFASSATATDAGPPGPVPLDVEPTVAPQTLDERILAVVFEAQCMRAHIPKAFESKADAQRLLAKYNFGEKQFRQLLRRFRDQSFQAKLEHKMAGCTSAVAYALYYGQ